MVFWSMGKGLREKQRRTVNGRGARIRALVFHGIKSGWQGFLDLLYTWTNCRRGYRGPLVIPWDFQLKDQIFGKRGTS